MRRDISRAIRTLAQAGVQIDRSKVEAAMRGASSTIRNRDLKNFRKWAAKSWAENARFIVGYTHDGELVFHSEAGLKKLQDVAANARSQKSAEVADAKS